MIHLYRKLKKEPGLFHACRLAYVRQPVLGLTAHFLWPREDREDFDLKAASSEGQGTGVAKRGRPSGGAPADGPVSVGKRVYVNNLSHETTWQILKDHFRQAGNVVHAAVLTVRLQPHSS